MSTMLQQQPHQQQGQQGQQQLAPHPGLSQDPSKSHQAPQSVQVSSPYTTDQAEQVLREQLLAAHLTNASHTAPPPPRPQPGVPAHLQAAAAAAGAGGQRDHINIDPAISGMTAAPQVHTTAAMLAQPPQAQVPVGQQDMTGAPPGLDQTGEPRKVYGKRELSSSKRAAQNRAAQRAFRQRKEGYIRKLEEQVKEYEMLLDNYKAIQAENYQLREYIISLQSRLIDSQNEVPELPGNIDLSQPRPEPAIVTSGGQQQGQQGQQGQGQQGQQGQQQPGQQQAQQQGQQGHQQGGAGGQAGAGQHSSQSELNALNRIAVAGLGMRKHQHEEAAFLGQGGNFSKRTRQDGQDDSQAGEQSKAEQI
ncbi:hypothetical protein H112_02847 [Trichophyton rubrum D6]|uniref:Putative transcription factor kapC n=3 Tax=Trichophyton TaxID=5550 RepID=F2SSM5_TRIRC|nr:uncharacterized protein TERG_05479 [Trichophyton rubrum CBS 118892]EZF24748.1 hypothetical protein H100_02852 [Trichophyton rubrum MR850]EZF43709.1 hypothetical protein H102_02845 [Trichophyton rubrum CBS 100081]EZF54409.1 hypothetical protein H103_02858 [Trichophyton rubrum CBS 288.86]EZF64963.1 hypothetical protein H104_02837 [Trichophyton rubrum CBS 289.86]EZF75678.1 hypothetical protein H105_02864 [Trichophyton soudanense CBS 452.61]EZF86308.1 hypothetical protein H110_02857 [Trichophy